MRFTVYGTPGPKGSKRHVGNGVMVESSAKVKPWAEAVKWAAFEAMQPRAGQGIRGPVSLHVTFTLAKPKSAPKKMRSYPERKPDIDKLLRSTLDALKSAGCYEDDARVIELTAAKRFPHEGDDSLHLPGAVIRITSAVSA